eukprot:12083015-Prorocentrum_lima.AAC.1
MAHIFMYVEKAFDSVDIRQAWQAEQSDLEHIGIEADMRGLINRWHACSWLQVGQRDERKW